MEPPVNVAESIIASIKVFILRIFWTLKLRILALKTVILFSELPIAFHSSQGRASQQAAASHPGQLVCRCLRPYLLRENFPANENRNTFLNCRCCQIEGARC